MDQYQKGTANYNRLKTDRLLMDFDLRAVYTGAFERAAKFIHDEQAMNVTLWKRFVEQFRLGDDSEKGAWRGEYWGKMMRGACFVYSYTRDEALYRVLRDTVEDMMTTQDEQGRIASFTAEKELFGWDMWCRKYVLLGMQYFMEINDDEELNARIIDSMCGQVDYIMSKVGPEEGKLSIYRTSQTWRGLNSSTILEPIVRLYSLTGDERYFEFATYIIECGGTEFGNLVDMACEDRLMPYQYPVTKAYEMMSFFEGVLEYYRLTGIEKYKTAILNYGRRVAETEISIIGSAGCTHELMDYTKVRQCDLNANGLMQETCVTVTWMKFCAQLLLVSGEVTFADRMEQAYYNAYVGAINFEKRVDQHTPVRYEQGKFDQEPILEYLHFDSYSPLRPGTRGAYVGGLQQMRDGHYYGCCACIGAAGQGVMHKTAALWSKDGVALSFYFPGALQTKTPAGEALELKIETAYPVDGKIRITVNPAAEEAFDLTLRIPAWCKKATVAVNGKSAPAEAGWLTLSRAWKAGDTVTLELAMEAEFLKPEPFGEITVNTDVHWKEDKIYPITFQEQEGHMDQVAITRGPLVLAADARLGYDPADPIEPDGTVRLIDPATLPFPAELALAIGLKNGGERILVDYASAGKTLDESSKMAAWMPTK
ncbi:MAG: glycoside hydrolase family 127 protein [Clostridia bacterium]|nr:glycoside hydrolase family 127 protein [Clostridia bacterium]